MRMLFAAVASLVLALPAISAEKKVTLSGDNTKITFVGTKPGGKPDGGFKTLTGNATVDGGALTKLAVEIEHGSLCTRTMPVDAHLKSPDFFSA